jgi:hypothetical protein
VILAFMVVSIKGAASSALGSLVRAAATALAVYVGCVAVGSVFEGGRIQTVTVMNAALQVLRELASGSCSEQKKRLGKDGKFSVPGKSVLTIDYKNPFHTQGLLVVKRMAYQSRRFLPPIRVHELPTAWEKSRAASP